MQVSIFFWALGTSLVLNFSPNGVRPTSSHSVHDVHFSVPLPMSVVYFPIVWPPLTTTSPPRRRRLAPDVAIDCGCHGRHEHSEQPN